MTCTAVGGRCVRLSSCGKNASTISVPNLCPGSGRVTCCLPDTPKNRYIKKASKNNALKNRGAVSWKRAVRNDISALADAMLANITVPGASSAPLMLCKQ